MVDRVDDSCSVDEFTIISDSFCTDFKVVLLDETSGAIVVVVVEVDDGDDDSSRFKAAKLC